MDVVCEIPEALNYRHDGNVTQLDTETTSLSPSIELHVTRFAVDSSFIDDASNGGSHEMCTSKDEQWIIVGFRYAVTVFERSVEFYCDIVRQENFRLIGGECEYVNRKTINSGSSDVEIAVVEVIDTSILHPLTPRFSWMEIESSKQDLHPGVTLNIMRMWAKNGNLSRVKCVLDVSIDQDVKFRADFRGSQNLELIDGGLEVNCFADKNIESTVAILQIVSPDEPTLFQYNCHAEPYRRQPLIKDGIHRRTLAPDVLLLSEVLKNESGLSLKHQLICCKACKLEYNLDYDVAENIVVDAETMMDGEVQPWDRVDLPTMYVVEKSKRVILKARLTWIEHSIPTLFSNPSQDEKSVLGKEEEHVHWIEFEA